MPSSTHSLPSQNAYNDNNERLATLLAHPVPAPVPPIAETPATDHYSPRRTDHFAQALNSLAERFRLLETPTLVHTTPVTPDPATLAAVPDTPAPTPTTVPSPPSPNTTARCIHSLEDATRLVCNLFGPTHVHAPRYVITSLAALRENLIIEGGLKASLLETQALNQRLVAFLWTYSGSKNCLDVFRVWTNPLIAGYINYVNF